jgi:hypothetical protein
LGNPAQRAEVDEDDAEPLLVAPGPFEVVHQLTIFLSTAGSGGIDHVVNGVDGSSTIANPDTPVNVVSYP